MRDPYPNTHNGPDMETLFGRGSIWRTNWRTKEWPAQRTERSAKPPQDKGEWGTESRLSVRKLYTCRWKRLWSQKTFIQLFLFSSSCLMSKTRFTWVPSNLSPWTPNSSKYLRSWSWKISSFSSKWRIHSHSINFRIGDGLSLLKINRSL